MGSSVGVGLIGDTQDPYEVLFSKPGSQDTGMSEAYPCRRSARAYGGHVSLPSAVAANAVLTVYLDGVSVGTITVLAGHSSGAAVFPRNDGDPGVRVSVAWTANPPASGCTVIIDMV